MEDKRLIRTLQEMNSTKSTRYSYGRRGRGNKRNLVRLNATKVSQEHGRVLNEQRDSNGVYEDVMVYVKNQAQAITTRKPRGRPRKCLMENNSNQAATGSRPEVIYVPSVKQGSSGENLVPAQYKEGSNSFSQIVLKQTPHYKVVLPSKSCMSTVLGTNSKPNSTLISKLLNPHNPIVTVSTPYGRSILGTKISSQDAFGRKSYSQTTIGIKSSSQHVFGSSIQTHSMFKGIFNKTPLGSNLNLQSVLRSNQTLINRSQTNKPVLEATPVAVTSPVAPHQSETKSDWPEDLQELWDMWDHYPERQIDRWLKSPLSFNSSDLPPVVANIHQHIEMWDENEEAKLENICDLLLDKKSFGQTVSTGPPPKVVVEVQPNSQHCGSWSSMNELAT